MSFNKVLLGHSHTHSLTYCCWQSAFLLPQQSGVVATESFRPTALKYLPFGCLWKKFLDAVLQGAGRPGWPLGYLHTPDYVSWSLALEPRVNEKQSWKTIWKELRVFLLQKNHFLLSERANPSGSLQVPCNFSFLGFCGNVCEEMKGCQVEEALDCENVGRWIRINGCSWLWGHNFSLRIALVRDCP